MEQSFADLLTDDAFPETSLPSFPDGELDFERLDFDEEEDKTGGSHKDLTIPTKEDAALHQEATGQSDALPSSLETHDINKAADVDKQETDTKRDKEEEHCESSDGGGSASTEDEDVEKEDRGMGEKPEGWSMSARWDSDKEDRIFAEGQPLAPEGTENPQVRNKEHGESESGEDMSYFGSVPKRGSGMTMQVDEIEDEERQREDERREDSTDTDCEMKIEKEEVKEGNLLTRCFPQDDEDHQSDTFELPEVLMRNLQDLIADDDSEEDVDKVKDFSGEDHQEAGESFADYPSDFSSCEYMEDGRTNQESKNNLKVLPCTSDSGSDMKENTHLERGAAEMTWMGSAAATDEKEDQDLDSGGIGIEVDGKIAGLDLATEEIDKRGTAEIVKHISGNAAVKGGDGGDGRSEHTCTEDEEGEEEEEEEDEEEEEPNFSQYQYNDSDSDSSERRHQSESDTYSSSDEIQVRSDEESTDNVRLQGPENNEPLEDARPHSENRAALSSGNMSDDLSVTNDCSRGDLRACGISWDTDITPNWALLSEDLLSTEDSDEEETLLLDVTAAELVPVDIHSVVQLGDDAAVHSSHQGSVDDCFFFNNEYEASRVTEPGQFGDDEYEEERNWEQERERIKAFYKFYNDSEEENGTEGRKIKVQFCTDPLSQVIHYDTDSSDSESLNSSTEGEEDLIPAETYTEPRECETLNMNSDSPHPTHNLSPEHVTLDPSNPQLRTRKHKCLGILMLILKIGLAILMGLLMLWLATHQLDWLDQDAFF